MPRTWANGAVPAHRLRRSAADSAGRPQDRCTARRQRLPGRAAGLPPEHREQRHQLRRFARACAGAGTGKLPPCFGQGLPMTGTLPGQGDRHQRSPQLQNSLAVFHGQIVVGLVQQGGKAGARTDCFHRCCRAAEQLRRLLCGRHCRSRRQHHLHRTVCPSARHPELPDLLCRPGPIPRHPLRGHAGGVRQPRQDPRRSCHQLGVGRRHPDMDFPPAGRELGGLYRRQCWAP